MSDEPEAQAKPTHYKNGGLPADVRTFIIVHLACYETPSTVAAKVKEEFDIELSRGTVAYYNPEGSTGDRLSAEYRELFEETRKKFNATLMKVPIARLGFRLLQLQRILDDATDDKDIATKLAALEQAAKERGGAYTNRRELTGRGGGPIESAGVMIYLPSNGRDGD